MTTKMDKPRGNPTFNPATHLQVSPHHCGGIFGRGIVPHLTTMSCCLACWSTSNESFVTPSFLEFLGGNPPRTCQFTMQYCILQWKAMKVGTQKTTRYLRRLSSVCIWLEHIYIIIYWQSLSKSWPPPNIIIIIIIIVISTKSFTSFSA